MYIELKPIIVIRLSLTFFLFFVFKRTRTKKAVIGLAKHCFRLKPYYSGSRTSMYYCCSGCYSKRNKDHTMLENVGKIGGKQHLWFQSTDALAFFEKCIRQYSLFG